MPTTYTWTNTEKRIAVLETCILELDRDERECLRLRVELLLAQIDVALGNQYKHVKPMKDGDDLLSALDDAMSATKYFKRWFREYTRSDGRLHLEKYIYKGIGVAQRESKAVRKILSKMMDLLPKWLNVDISGCYCAQPHLLLDLDKGYRMAMIQGSTKVYADLEPEDVRESSQVILQVPIDPSCPMHVTVYIRERATGLRALFRRKYRKVFYDESFDPITLLGFEGTLYGKGDIELPVTVRLWPTSDCETLYQQLCVGSASRRVTSSMLFMLLGRTTY
ncbi:uncharacterized protein LOC111263787 isoform X2 [Varroa jacobsoni]|uniref:uncharacterized protein LOC111263787 isoform X2 n=1 Tax=Varroa jacobsoni TaxID=62625 RepID=UPI000BFA3D11|nr:uncharacterized protein LOC111263787 isoform X2 [Varroa jacobsoni]